LQKFASREFKLWQKLRSTKSIGVAVLTLRGKRPEGKDRSIILTGTKQVLTDTRVRKLPQEPGRNAVLNGGMGESPSAKLEDTAEAKRARVFSLARKYSDTAKKEYLQKISYMIGQSDSRSFLGCQIGMPCPPFLKIFL